MACHEFSCPVVHGGEVFEVVRDDGGVITVATGGDSGAGGEGVASQGAVFAV